MLIRVVLLVFISVVLLSVRVHSCSLCLCAFVVVLLVFIRGCSFYSCSFELFFPRFVILFVLSPVVVVFFLFCSFNFCMFTNPSVIRYLFASFLIQIFIHDPLAACCFIIHFAIYFTVSSTSQSSSFSLQSASNFIHVIHLFHNPPITSFYLIHYFLVHCSSITQFPAFFIF